MSTHKLVVVVPLYQQLLLEALCFSGCPSICLSVPPTIMSTISQTSCEGISSNLTQRLTWTVGLQSHVHGHSKNSYSYDIKIHLLPFIKFL